MQRYYLRFIEKIVMSLKAQKGQSLVIMAFAFVGLIGMLGLAIDVGLIYIERIKVNRAVDAAVLAAVVELPSEEDAMLRAIEYLKLNGYDVGEDVEVVVRGCVTSIGGNVSEAGTNQGLITEPKDRIAGLTYIKATVLRSDKKPRARFMIDTGSYQVDPSAKGNFDVKNVCDKGNKAYGIASRIKVAGESLVDMNFMRLPSLGAFTEVPVYAEGIAENNANLDIMLVFDVSASMEYLTACIDCWVKTSEATKNSSIPYPDNGYFNPLPYNTSWFADLNNDGKPDQSPTSSIPDSGICNPKISRKIDPNKPAENIDATYTVPSVQRNYLYSFFEAELYSAVWPKNAWEQERRQAGEGFWAMQRGSMNEQGGYTAYLNGGIPFTPFDAAAADYYRGPQSAQDFFLGNQAGNPDNQSANVCNPGISKDPQGIDCKLGYPKATKNICQSELGGYGPIDCSAYVQALPYLAYFDVAGGRMLGGTYDKNCFSGSGDCWDGTFPPNNSSPYLEYDFTNRGAGSGEKAWGNTTHIWIRAIGGGQAATKWKGKTTPKKLEDRDPHRNALFWTVYKHKNWNVTIPPAKPIDSSQKIGASSPSAGQVGHWRDSRANNDDWRWVYLGKANTTEDELYTLRIYQGSAGYKIDRIMLTNNPETKLARYGSSNNQDDLYAALCNGEPSDPTHDNRCQNGSKPEKGLGSAISQGSGSREACNLCNPIYGLQLAVGDCKCRSSTMKPANLNKTSCTLDDVSKDSNGQFNQLANDLYNGTEPLRGAQQAAKAFVEGLNPQFDQVGFVAFSNDVVNNKNLAADSPITRSKLECIRSSGVSGCYGGNAPISYTNVINAIENQWPLNGTDIAEGLREGLEELGVGATANNDCSPGVDNGQSCSRGQAAQPIIILLTDGIPSDAPGVDKRTWLPPDLDRSDGCAAKDIWGKADPYYNCAMHYAYQAHDKGVTLYTIGLGSGVDADLLQAMATGSYTDDSGISRSFFSGKGKFYAANSPSELNAIFEEILDAVYVTLVG